ncbi:MAG: aspartyl protease family protein [Ferruginibacter sp.]
MEYCRVIKTIFTILTFLLSAASFAQRSFLQNADSLLETIPFKTFTGGVIVIQAKLGELPLTLNFILDTGSGGISLDSATCSEQNISIKGTDTTVSGIAGIKKVPFAFDQKIQLGKLVSEHVNFYVNDYSLLTSTFGEKIDGIIGYGLLSRYIFHINFDSAEIKIYRPGNFKYQAGGKILKPMFGRLPAQRATVRDRRKAVADFYLDTGAGLCLLMSESFIKDSSILFTRRKPVMTQAEGLGGKKPMRLTVVKQVKLGPYSFKNVPVYLYNDETNILSYPYTAGLLGNDLMRRFNMTLNYPKKEVHIIPNGHYNDHFDYAFTGMSLYAVNERIFIDDIVAGSPAEIAGLKNGDVLVSVSNNITGNIQDYKNLLQNIRDAVKIIIKRKELLMFFSLKPVSIR